MKDDFQNSAVGPGSLLVFTSEMDPYFWRSVVLVLAHDERGSLGVTINEPLNESDYTYEALVEKSEGLDPLVNVDDQFRVLLSGGPVEEQTRRLFVIHDTPSDGNDGLSLAYVDFTAEDSHDQIVRIAQSEPSQARIALDYTGWGAGRLNAEIKAGAWRVLPYDPALVFNTAFSDVFAKAAEAAGLHEDLVRYIENPAEFRGEFDDHAAAYDYLSTIRPQPPV